MVGAVKQTAGHDCPLTDRNPGSERRALGAFRVVNDENGNMKLDDWIFVLGQTIVGTLVYSTIVLAVIQSYVSQSVFDFLNIWLSVAFVPLMIYVCIKYVRSVRK